MSESKVLELFGTATRRAKQINWRKIVAEQRCPFTRTKCFKVRKSDPEISIGTCSVRYGRERKSLVICPNRLLERGQVFTDCIQLLTQHEPGNEFHVVPEVAVPGGSIDYFLASVRRKQVKDFVGIEFQSLDSTGTIWPERQRFLQRHRIPAAQEDATSKKTFGINWKMTAKTILVQLHHKVETFELFNKHLVLVAQQHLLEYMRREFSFEHLDSARLGDPMHIHCYALVDSDDSVRLELQDRLSTDTAGVAKCLGLQAEAKVELGELVAELERRISADTLLSLDSPAAPGSVVLSE